MRKLYLFRIFDVKGNLSRISDFTGIKRKVYRSDIINKLIRSFDVELLAVLVIFMIAINLYRVTSNSAIILGFLVFADILLYSVVSMFIYYLIQCCTSKDIKNKIEEHNRKVIK